MCTPARRIWVEMNGDSCGRLISVAPFSSSDNPPSVLIFLNIVGFMLTTEKSQDKRETHTQTPVLTGLGFEHFYIE